METGKLVECIKIRNGKSQPFEHEIFQKLKPPKNRPVWKFRYE